MDKISKEDILNALQRSGYLLENRVLEYFVKQDFWSESSHRFFLNEIEDKFREIDIIATKKIDTYDITETQESLTLFIHFFCECINNPVPLALFQNIGDTEEPTSDWSYKFTNGSQELREIGSLHWPYSINHFQEQIIESLPARQYCGFAEKKGSNKDKWMANHPDDFHQTLTKLVTFVKFKSEETSNRWDDVRPQMGRLDLFIPLIVLQNEIIEVISQERIEIKDADYYRLKVPYERNYNKSLSIDIIKESFLERYLEIKINGIQLMFKDLKNHLIEEYA